MAFNVSFYNMVSDITILLYFYAVYIFDPVGTIIAFCNDSERVAVLFWKGFTVHTVSQKDLIGKDVF